MKWLNGTTPIAKADIIAKEAEINALSTKASIVDYQLPIFR